MGKKKAKKDTSVFKTGKKSLLSIKSHSCPQNVTYVEKKPLLFVTVDLGRKSHFCFSKRHFCPLNLYLHMVILKVVCFFFNIATQRQEREIMTPLGSEGAKIPRLHRANWGFQFCWFYQITYFRTKIPRMHALTY